MSDPVGDATVGAGNLPAMRGRLHPSVIALWSVRAIAPLAALWVAGSVQRFAALGVAAVVVISSVIRWTRFEWRVEADDLVIEHGLLQRTRRVLPRERIQAVQTVRKIRHRIFGVVGLRIEAIGGSDTEGQLDALTPDVAAAVQRRLIGGGAVTDLVSDDATGVTESRGDVGAVEGVDDTVTKDPPTTLVHCPPRMLLLAGLTGGRVGVAAAVLAFAQEYLGERVDAVLSVPQRFGLTALIGLLVAGLVLAFGLSVLATAVTYWDFTVVRDEQRIVLRRGLLDERRDTVPVHRIQSVTVEENLVRRMLGLAAVRMTVAGRAGDEGGVTSTLVPIATRAQAFALAGDVLGVAVPSPDAMHAMPAAARSRRLVRAVLASALLTGLALAITRNPVGLLALLSAAVTVPAALVAYRALGWSVDAQVVTARAGLLVRRTTVTPIVAPNSVQVSRSPFQRRRDLATVRLEIARSGGRDPRLLDLGDRDADRLQRSLADVLVTT